MVKVNFNPHLQLQRYIESLCPNALLECRFPHINRIADVLIGQTVFEIQVSPITVSEVQERNHDYESQGLTIVWLLHDKRYNQKLLPYAEGYLRKQRYALFFRVEHTGECLIYNQFEKIEGRVRIVRSPPQPIDLRRGDPLIVSREKERAWRKEIEPPRPLKQRLLRPYLRHLQRLLERSSGTNSV